MLLPVNRTTGTRWEKSPAKAAQARTNAAQTQCVKETLRLSELSRFGCHIRVAAAKVLYKQKKDALIYKFSTVQGTQSVQNIYFLLLLV